MLGGGGVVNGGCEGGFWKRIYIPAVCKCQFVGRDSCKSWIETYIHMGCIYFGNACIGGETDISHGFNLLTKRLCALFPLLPRPTTLHTTPKPINIPQSYHH